MKLFVNIILNKEPRIHERGETDKIKLKLLIYKFVFNIENVILALTISRYIDICYFINYYF